MAGGQEYNPIKSQIGENLYEQKGEQVEDILWGGAYIMAKMIATLIKHRRNTCI